MSNDGPTYGTPDPMPPQQPGTDLASQGRGFFGALFDFSFNHFVTPMIVKAVYVIATVVVALTWLVFLLTSFSQSSGLGVVVLLLGPIIAILYLAVIRMTLEFYLAVVRMSEDIHTRLR